MNFLRPTDYNKLVKSDNLNSIVDDDNSLLDQAELTAVEEMTSYLVQRFDTSKIFSYTNEYDSGVTYNSGDRVFSASTAGTYSYFYSNVSGNTGNSILNSSFWISGDNRSQQIVTYTTDITLYHIYSRVAPRNIPDLRGIRYDNALKWLNMVACGKITAQLPNYESASGQTGYSIRYGASTNKNNNFF